MKKNAPLFKFSESIKPKPLAILNVPKNAYKQENDISDHIMALLGYSDGEEKKPSVAEGECGATMHSKSDSIFSLDHTQEKVEKQKDKEACDCNGEAEREKGTPHPTYVIAEDVQKNEKECVVIDQKDSVCKIEQREVSCIKEEKELNNKSPNTNDENFILTDSKLDTNLNAILDTKLDLIPNFNNLKQSLDELAKTNFSFSNLLCSNKISTPVSVKTDELSKPSIYCIDAAGSKQLETKHKPLVCEPLQCHNPENPFMTCYGNLRGDASSLQDAGGYFLNANENKVAERSLCSNEGDSNVIAHVNHGPTQGNAPKAYMKVTSKGKKLQQEEVTSREKLKAGQKRARNEAQNTITVCEEGNSLSGAFLGGKLLHDLDSYVKSIENDLSIKSHEVVVLKQEICSLNSYIARVTDANSKKQNEILGALKDVRHTNRYNEEKLNEYKCYKNEVEAYLEVFKEELSHMKGVVSSLNTKNEELLVQYNQELRNSSNASRALSSCKDRLLELKRERDKCVTMIGGIIPSLQHFSSEVTNCSLKVETIILAVDQVSKQLESINAVDYLAVEINGIADASSQLKDVFLDVKNKSEKLELENKKLRVENNRLGECNTQQDSVISNFLGTVGKLQTSAREIKAESDGISLFMQKMKNDLLAKSQSQQEGMLLHKLRERELEIESVQLCFRKKIRKLKKRVKKYKRLKKSTKEMTEVSDADMWDVFAT